MKINKIRKLVAYSLVGLLLSVGLFQMLSSTTKGETIIYEPISEMPENAMQLLMEHETHLTGEKVTTPLIMAFSAIEVQGVGAYFEDLEVRIKLPDDYAKTLSIDSTFLAKNQLYNQYNPSTKTVTTNKATKFTFDTAGKYLSLKFENFAIQTNAGSNINYMVEYQLKNGNVLPTTLNFETELYLNGQKVSDEVVPKSNYKAQINSELDKLVSGSVVGPTSPYKVSDSYNEPVTLALSNNAYFFYNNITNSNSATSTGAIYIEKYQATFEVDIPEGVDYELATRNIYVANYNYSTVGVGVKANSSWKVEIVENTDRKIKVVVTYDAKGDVKAITYRDTTLMLYLNGSYTFTFKAPAQPKITVTENETYQNFTSSEVTAMPERKMAQQFYRKSYFTEEQVEAYKASEFTKTADVEEATYGDLITYSYDDITDLGNPYMQDIVIGERSYDKDYLEVVSVYAGEYDRPDDIEVSFGQLTTQSEYAGTKFILSGTPKILSNGETYDVETNQPGLTKENIGLKITNKAGKTGEVKVLKSPSITFRVKPSYKYDYGTKIKNAAELNYYYFFGGLATKRYITTKDSVENVTYIPPKDDEEYKDNKQPKLTNSKTATNKTRSTGENLPLDVIEYALTVKNVSTANDLTEFVIVDTPSEYLDISTLSNPTITTSSGSTLTLDASYKDSSTSLSGVSRIVTNSEGKKEIHIAFKNEIGVLKNGGTVTIKYQMKIKNDASFVTAKNTFKVLKLNSENKLIDSGLDGASSSIFITGKSPKVGIQSTVDNTNPESTENITVTSTIKNFEYTYADGVIPGSAEDFILAYTSGDIREYFGSRLANSQYSYSYISDSFEILGVYDQNGDIIESRDIGDVNVSYKRNDTNASTVTVETGQLYFDQFKLTGIKLEQGESLKVRFKMKPDAAMFQGTSENYKNSFTRTLDSKVFVGANYKNDSNVKTAYRYKTSIALESNLNFGSLIGYNRYTNYLFDGPIPSGSNYTYHNYINHNLSIKIKNPNMKMRLDTNVSYGKRSGSTYNIASSTDGNKTFNIDQKEDFITIFSLSSPSDGNDEQSLGTMVFEIDPHQTVDISKGFIANSATGYGYDWSKFEIEDLGGGTYRVDLSDVTIKKGETFKLFLPTKVNQDFDANWEDSQMKGIFETKFSLFLEDSSKYYKTPAEVNATTATDRRFIAVDEDLETGGLDGKLDTTYRLETSGYANYIREVYYPGILNYSDTVATSSSIQPTDTISIQTFITNKNLSSDVTTSYGKNPYIVIDIPQGMDLQSKLIIYSIGDGNMGNITIGDDQIKKLPDGRTRVTIHFTQLKQTKAQANGLFDRSIYYPAITFNLSSSVATGYGSKVVETYLIPEQDFRAENIIPRGDTTGNPAYKAYSSGDYYTELDKEYGFSDFISETGLNKAVKTKSIINFSGTIGFNSGVSLTSTQGEAPNSKVTSGSNTLLNLYPGNVFATSGTMTNSSTSDYKLRNVSLIAMPAREHDKQVLSDSERHSTWTPEFKDIKSVKLGAVGANESTYVEVNPSLYQVSYTDAITAVAGKNFNNNDWSGSAGGQSTWTSDRSSIEEVIAFRILFDSSFEIPKGYQVIFTYDSKVPDTIIPAEVDTFLLGLRPAYQSYAWKFNTTVGGGDIGFQPFEPEKVGVNLKDPKDGSMTLQKNMVDFEENAKTPSGSVYRLYLKQKNFTTNQYEYYKTIDLKATNNYQVDLSDLEYGYYQIQEVYLVENDIEYPIGDGFETPVYTIDGEVKDTFTLNALSKEHPVSIAIKNQEKELTLTLTKMANKHSNPSESEAKEGVIFELYKDGTQVDTQTTSALGKLTFSGLDYGTYELVELAPLNSKPQGFTDMNETEVRGSTTYHKYKKEIILPTLDADEGAIVVNSEITIHNDPLYKVVERYEDEDGTALQTEKTAYYEYEADAILHPATFANYSYEGYTLDGGILMLGVPLVDDIVVDHVVTYKYAINRYKVDETYVDGAGNPIKLATSSTLKHGGNYSKAPPMIAGYTFVSLEKDAVATSDASAIFTNVTSNHSVKFVYSQNEYTVYYRGNGNTEGSEPEDNTTYYHEDEVTVLGNSGNLEREGYTFVGWSTSSTATTAEYEADDTFTITDSTVLYAVWEAIPVTYTVEYRGNGNSGGTAPVDAHSPYLENSSVSVLGKSASLVKTGYTFVGWSTNPTATTAEYEANDTFTITSNTVLYAVWEAIPVTYTVEYRGNGNSGGTAPVDADSPYVENSSVTVLGKSASLVKTGYTFLGWSTSSTATTAEYEANDTFTITSNTVLYAVWEEETIITKHTVEYLGNGHTSGTVPMDVDSPYDKNSNVTILGNTGTLEKEGHEFLGWSVNASATIADYVAEDVFVITGNTVLYAVWKEQDASIPKKYTVEYVGNGHTNGNVPIDRNNPYEENTVVIVKGNEQALGRTGYIFLGWSKNANATIPEYRRNDTFTITNNTVLYAVWEQDQLIVPKTYTIKYQGNGQTGGEVPLDSTSYEENAVVTVFGNVNALVKTGYTFRGWSENINAKMVIYQGSETFTITKDTVLYAVWEKNIEQQEEEELTNPKEQKPSIAVVERKTSTSLGVATGDETNSTAMIIISLLSVLVLVRSVVIRKKEE